MKKLLIFIIIILFKSSYNYEKNARIILYQILFKKKILYHIIIFK